MVEFKLWCARLLVVSCAFVVVVGGTASPMNAQEKPANAVELLQSKQSLAQKALRELGISEQYDRFLDNCLDIAIANNNQNSPFRISMWKGSHLRSRKQNCKSC